MLTLLVAAWNNAKPDRAFSFLGARYPIGQDTGFIIRELESLGFDYTLYDYSNDRFRVISGTPALSPLETFQDAPIDLLGKCNEFDCSVIRSSKLEFVYVFGVMRLHHTYRYLWIFHEDELVGVSENNHYWGSIY